MYNRYCTYSDYDDNVFVLAQGETAVKIPDSAADWVWQFAKSEEEAKANHFKSYDKLYAILNEGLEMPHTIGTTCTRR